MDERPPDARTDGSRSLTPPSHEHDLSQIGSDATVLVSAFHGCADGIAIQNAGGRFAFVNRAAERLFGRSRSEFVGRTEFDVFPSAAAQALVGQSRRVVETGLSHSRSYELLVGGSMRRFDETRSPIRGSAAEVLGVMIVTRDVTAADRSQRDQQHSERLASLGVLAAGIAHEINNPLGLIRLTAELCADFASKDTESGQKLGEMLADIVAQVTRCDRIVRSVLKFARDEPTPKVVDDIVAALKHSIDLTREYASTCGVTLQSALEPNIRALRFNRIEMEQVFVNLILNAVQASSAGAGVTIESRRTPTTVQIVFRDEGRGMTREVQERVFDPFFTTRLSAGGTGLGLSVSRGIVMDHGGVIEIESAPGAGTMVTVSLPLEVSAP